MFQRKKVKKANWQLIYHYMVAGKQSAKKQIFLIFSFQTLHIAGSALKNDYSFEVCSNLEPA